MLSRHRLARTGRQQRGVALLEALVAMLIVAFGILGFVGLQARTATVNLEAYQRAQALMLVQDMASRINANRPNARSYATNSGSYIVGQAPNLACNGATLVERDVCEWGKLLRGAAETQSAGTSAVGAITKARGCIQNLGTDRVLVAVFWEGVQGSASSPVECGYATGEKFPAGVYTSDALRRSVSTVVRIGSLG